MSLITELRRKYGIKDKDFFPEWKTVGAIDNGGRVLFSDGKAGRLISDVELFPGDRVLVWKNAVLLVKWQDAKMILPSLVPGFKDLIFLVSGPKSGTADTGHLTMGESSMYMGETINSVMAGTTELLSGPLTATAWWWYDEVARQIRDSINAGTGTHGYTASIPDPDYRNDIILIEGPGDNLTLSVDSPDFLIYVDGMTGGVPGDPVTYAVFQYDSVKKTLKAVDFNILPFLTQVPTGYEGEEVGGACVASSEKFTEHHYTAGFTHLIPDANTGGYQNNFTPNVGAYEHNRISVYREGLCALRLSYEPVAFDPATLAFPAPAVKSPVFVVVTGATTDLCSARRDWYVTPEGEVRKNLRIKYESGKAKIKYETEAGTQYGATFDGTISPYYWTGDPYFNFWAVINDQEYFGIINAPGIAGENTTAYTLVSYQYEASDNIVPCSVGSGLVGPTSTEINWLCGIHWRETAGAKRLRFGPHILLDFGGGALDMTADAGGPQILFIADCLFSYENDEYKEIPLWKIAITARNITQRQVLADTNVPSWLCYDNVPGSSDEFICIISLKRDSENVIDGLTRAGSIVGGTQESGVIKRFYLYYKTRSLENPKVEEITYCGFTSITQYIDETITMVPWSTCAGQAAEKPCYTQGASVINSYTMKGQRVNKASCYITDKAIMYTYVLEDYIGDPGDPTGFDQSITVHMNDADPDTAWQFNKRIVGIIDRATGKRDEFEITDTVLGQYAPTFANGDPAAIGKHNNNA